LRPLCNEIAGSLPGLSAGGALCAALCVHSGDGVPKCGKRTFQAGSDPDPGQPFLQDSEIERLPDGTV
jgi:hypothetical protein